MPIPDTRCGRTERFRCRRYNSASRGFRPSLSWRCGVPSSFAFPLLEHLTSTTLVLLLHTLSCEFLCFCQLCGCHSLHNDISIPRRASISHWCCDVPPHMCIDVILKDTLTVHVHQTQSELRPRNPLFSRFAKPRHRFFVVMNNTLTGGYAKKLMAHSESI